MVKRPDISTEGDASVQPQAQAFDALPGFWSLLGRGLTRRCAWCGDRRVFQGLVSSGGIVPEHVITAGDVAMQRLSWGNDRQYHPHVFDHFDLNLGCGFSDVARRSNNVADRHYRFDGCARTRSLVPVSFSLWQAVDLFMRRPDDDELAGLGDADL